MNLLSIVTAATRVQFNTTQLVAAASFGINFTPDFIKIIGNDHKIFVGTSGQPTTMMP